MDNRKPIVDELMAISPLLAGLLPINPYFIATGFFDVFNEQMLERIAIEKGSLRNNRIVPYVIPPGYFDGFVSDLFKRIHSADTLSAKSELDILSPVLNKLDRKAPFTAPVGYFDELSDNLVSGMKAIDFVNEELENSPVLNELKHRPVFTVPSGYFEQFPVTILNKVKSTAKLVQMSRRVRLYAVAAILAGLVILGVVYVKNNNAPVTSLASLQADVKQNIRTLSDEAIINYVDNNEFSLSETAVVTNTVEIKEEDLKVLLADISDEELQRYVEQTGEKFLTN